MRGYQSNESFVDFDCPGRHEGTSSVDSIIHACGVLLVLIPSAYSMTKKAATGSETLVSPCLAIFGIITAHVFEACLTEFFTF